MPNIYFFPPVPRLKLRSLVPLCLCMKKMKFFTALVLMCMAIFSPHYLFAGQRNTTGSQPALNSKGSPGNVMAASDVPFFESGGMKFTIQGNGGNCGSCVWVLAEGEIEVGTTEKFKEFVQKEDPPINIRFNSPGGNLVESLALGQYLRDQGWNTFVGEATEFSLGEYKTQLSHCYSACVYAFTGGVHRTADDKLVGIHQFYRPDDALKPNDKTISALDMANMQRLTAVLNEYVRRMGVDQRLVTIASTITPWEPIYLLSKEELKALNLDNTSPTDTQSPANWRVLPVGNGAMAYVEAPQNGAGRIASLGLTCVEGTPSMIIARLEVHDQTIDWNMAEKNGLEPQYFNFKPDGNNQSLNPDRLIAPVEVSNRGVLLGLTITNDELEQMLKSKSLEIDGFVSMFVLRAVGPLGGTFPMTGASDVVRLAFKNCISSN